MSGGEILPGAAKVASDLGKKVMSEDAATKAQLARMSEDSPEMKAAAQAYAKRVAVRQHLVLQIMRPLGRLAGFSKDYFENNFADELADRLSDVPEEQVQSPPPTVAVPAMQALGYSLDEPDLKDMYLNLLANASDKRKKGTSHPAFSEVIKQLSGEETRLLGQLLAASIIPIVRVKTTDGSGFNIAHHNLIEIKNAVTGEQVENGSLSAWIENWIRLGLVERDYANFLTSPQKYAWTDARPEVIRLKEEGKGVQFDKGTLRATDFGRRFAKAVGSDEQARADRDKWRAIADALASHEGRNPAGGPQDDQRATGTAAPPDAAD